MLGLLLCEAARMHTDTCLCALPPSQHLPLRLYAAVVVPLDVGVAPVHSATCDKLAASCSLTSLLPLLPLAPAVELTHQCERCPHSCRLHLMWSPTPRSQLLHCARARISIFRKSLSSKHFAY
mmetsp:Transcript_20050/g.42804  ORF Transcript_20050/g.42804 Transcript_20050/m.42804 type:complete len:123 (-) Transcript_20050:237-605(-)